MDINSARQLAISNKLVVRIIDPSGSIKNKHFWEFFDRCRGKVKYCDPSYTTAIGGDNTSAWRILSPRDLSFASMGEIYSFVDTCINNIGEIYAVDLYRQGNGYFIFSFYLTDDLAKIREDKINSLIDQ